MASPGVSVKTEERADSITITGKNSHFRDSKRDKRSTSQPRTRQIVSKSRNGCITCKQRRLKCDETHPVCQKCTSKGFVCGGYTVAFKWKSFDHSDPGSRQNKFITADDPRKRQASAATMIPETTTVNSSAAEITTARKQSRSLSNVDPLVLQKALEEATYSLTGKTSQEVAIANALISSGKNPELASAVAEILKKRQETLEVPENSAKEDAMTMVNPLNTLADAVQGDITQVNSPAFSRRYTLPSPGLTSTSDIMKSSNFMGPNSPNFIGPSAAGTPNLEELLHAFENSAADSPQPIKLRSHASPTPSEISNFNAPRYSSLIRSFTNFNDPSMQAPSPANLDHGTEVAPGKKRRFSEISSSSPAVNGPPRTTSKRSNSESLAAKPMYPGLILAEEACEETAEDVGSSEKEPISDTVTPNSSLAPESPNEFLTMEEWAESPQMPAQLQLNDDNLRIMAGFEKYTSSLMSMIGGDGNPWVRVLIPLAQEHSVLRNVFSAMTCFHLARGDESIRAKGVRYMKNTVVELAQGFKQGTMPPEIGLVTCLCLQNSETWDRHTSTGIVHLKGAKSMLLQILKNVQEGKKFLLDDGEGRSDHDGAGARTVANDGDILVGAKISKNLAFLFNSFVYFDVLARLTAECNDDIYGEIPRTGVARKSSSPLNRPEVADDTSSESSTSSFSSRSDGNVTTSISFSEIARSINLQTGHLDPLLGCAHSLFPLIGKTADLVRQAEREAKNSLSIVSAAVQIKYELEQWHPPAVGKLPKGEDAELASCISTAEAYRYATLTLLHQAVPEIPSKSSHELSETVLMLLASIPNSSKTCITHIFPLLVASCEATPGEERDWVLGKWDALIDKMWIGNIERSLEVVKECWIRRDIKRKNGAKPSEGAEKLASRISAYVSSVRGEVGTQEDDLSVTGVKSWCHWRRIMREWGWEVFLG